jgi:hypothetical protein
MLFRSPEKICNRTVIAIPSTANATSISIRVNPQFLLSLGSGGIKALGIP